MLFNLDQRIAVITGAGSGIGKAIAHCFATQGAHVCLLDVNDTLLLKTAEEIQTKGLKASTHHCNVVHQTDCFRAMDEIVVTFGRIDILVNSAGIAAVANLESTSEAEFDRVFQVNVKGTYNCMIAAVAHMKQQMSGVILNMASVAATVGLADRFAYSMSKGAVVSMTLSVANDYVKSGIRCNCISPARVHTPFVDGFLKANYPGKEKEMFERLSKVQPIGRMGTPDEIAYLALYLCSEEASFVTGCDYPIDGGFTKLAH
jgi:NAD(P)-dependent dehydrogenase (short-subunit alcohol dehydrogenase family)